VVPTIEGHRPLLVEVQALVAPSRLAQPRRSAQGLESGRLSVVLAVLQRHAKLDLAGNDVWAMAVGGVRITEPGVDLAVALAIVSCVLDKPVPRGTVACGELGLSGEVRRVSGLEQRLSEAARHGFTSALVPLSAPPTHPDIALIRVAEVDDAIREIAG
jgi:DNA repair protein RadA/Sms